MNTTTFYNYMENLDQLRKDFKHEREIRGWSAALVGETIGCAQNTIHSFEVGRFVPRSELLTQLVKLTTEWKEETGQFVSGAGGKSNIALRKAMKTGKIRREDYVNFKLVPRFFSPN